MPFDNKSIDIASSAASIRLDILTVRLEPATLFDPEDMDNTSATLLVSEISDSRPDEVTALPEMSPGAREKLDALASHAISRSNEIMRSPVSTVPLFPSIIESFNFAVASEFANLPSENDKVGSAVPPA